jgi:hypothetical protein
MLIALILSDKRKVSLATNTPKFSSNQHNQVSSTVKLAISLNSASGLERETTFCFFVFHTMREHPKIHSRYKVSDDPKDR